jgi:dolichyl-phosphate beta-glucosyltransferase
VVLPCYNEAERLPGTLQTLLAHLSQDPGQVEVLVVDDGSTDITVKAADAIAAGDARVRVLSCHPNHGKGFAVRAGMLAAEGELIVFTDADGSYGPGELDRIIGALDEAPVAIGERRPERSSAKPEWTASPSTSRRCGSPTGSAWRSRRSTSRLWTAKAARCGC